jgi:hypothetical protein
MKKKAILVLPAFLLALAGIVMTGCPTEAAIDEDSIAPFTFIKTGAVTLAKNTWSGGNNDQVILTGTITGMVVKDKEYKVKITGTLEKAAVIKVVVVSNADSEWDVLTNYGAVDSDISTEVDEDGKPLPKIHSAGPLDIVIALKAEKSAGGLTAGHNKVVLIAEKGNDPNVTENSQDGNSLGDAVVLIAEKDKTYPNIPADTGYQWGAAGKPADSVEADVNWTKSENWEAEDFYFDNTTAIPANAKVTYTLYLPKDATYSEYDEIQVQAAADNPWTTIGIQQEIKIANFVTEGNYLKFSGLITGSNTAVPATAIHLQVNGAWVAYKGKIAAKLGTITQ